MTPLRTKLARHTGLLPFLVNGTLGERDRERVREHLAASDSARSELDFLCLLSRELPALAGVDGPTELERRRILERVRREARAQRACVAVGRWARAREFLLGWEPRSWALAAALLCAVVEGVLLGQRSGMGGPHAGSFQPAGAASGAAIAVRFRETASEREIRDLLVQHHLRIVEGPSVLGVYGLAPLEGGADAEGMRGELMELRLRKELVVDASLR